MRRRNDQPFTYEEVLEHRKFLIEAGLSADKNFLLGLFNQVEPVNEKEREILLDERITREDKERNLSEAYAELYEEIIQGYEQGTRKICTPDFRTLTKEEELCALDAVYLQSRKELDA